MSDSLCDVKDCARPAVHSFKGEFWTFRICCECLHGEKPADDRLIGEQCYIKDLRNRAVSAASA